MDFNLNEEQKRIRDFARKFAQKEIEPVAAGIDKRDKFPEDIWQKMAKKGLCGIDYPKKYGGGGGDFLSYIIAVEEISKASQALSFQLVLQGSLSGGIINNFGTEDQRKKYLVPLAKGDKKGAFALTEPKAGSDAPRAIETMAKLDGNDYVINGEKHFISNAGIADTVILFAKTDKESIAAFIVGNDRDGFIVGKRDVMMGMRGSEHREITIKNLRLPKENLLGKEGEGYDICMWALNGSRISVAAQAVGCAQTALNESVKFSNERKRFGKKIESFQAIRWMIADMAAQIDAARLLTYRAAFVRGEGKSARKEGSMAKLFASDVAVNASRNAVQIHGGYGCTEGFKVERLYRDAKLLEIYEGTSEVHRMIISKEVRNEGLLYYSIPQNLL